MSTRDLALQALVIKHVCDTTTAAIKERRAALADELANGDRVGVTAPGEPDVEVGLVYRTKPKATAAVTDRPAFTAWMAERYPDNVEPTARLIGDWSEIFAVLEQHAPHLLDRHIAVRDWAEEEVLHLTVRAKQACGPGGELDIPGVAYEPPGPGTVTVKLSDDGPAVIEQLWREGRIDLRTGEVLALSAGQS